MILVGLAILVVDQLLDAVLAFNQDIVQATDLVLMVPAVFLLAEGALSLWRTSRMGPERPPG